MPKLTTQPNPQEQSFGARLVRYRTAMNLTRETLVNELSKAGYPCSKETVYNWESRDQIPRGELYLHLLQKIKKAGY